MEYLKDYGFETEDLKNIEKKYNENIIIFINENEIYLRETLEYLKEKQFNIKKIFDDNICIILENSYSLKDKVEYLTAKGLSYDQIEIILTDNELYSNIKLKKEDTN